MRLPWISVYYQIKINDRLNEKVRSMPGKFVSEIPKQNGSMFIWMKGKIKQQTNKMNEEETENKNIFFFIFVLIRIVFRKWRACGSKWLWNDV